MSTALLVIDTQVSMFEEEPEPPFQAEQMLAVIAGLLDRARASDTPIIFIRHYEPDWEPMSPGHPGFEVHPAIAPLPGEALIDKRASDSFYKTDLDEQLQALGVETLVVTGLQTELCVDASVRSALSHGYDVTLVTDGHSTWSGDDLSAQQIIEHHNRALRNVAHPDHQVVLKPGAEITFE